MDARPLQFLLNESRDNFKQSSALYAWGTHQNTFGNGDQFLPISSPILVGPSNTSWIALSISKLGSFALGIRSDGALFSWGKNDYGQLGTGDATAASIIYYTPTQIGTDSWLAVAAGSIHALGIKYIGAGYGSLFAWGDNTYGQLGDGTRVNKSSPVSIGSSTWIAVSAGHNFSIGIRRTAAGAGTIFTWGTNDSGQLGTLNATNFNRSSPVAVGSSSWIMVSAGYRQCLAIRYVGAGYGTLFAWGYNANGAIGDNTVANKSSPVAIGSNSWIVVESGSYTSYGIRRTAAGAGTLFAWGYNYYGNIGDNSKTSKSSPVAVGSSSWIMVSAGNLHCMAIRYVGAGYGTLFTWGYNTSGPLGDRTSVDKSSPVAIGSASWTLISAGNVTSAGNVDPSVLYMWGGTFSEFLHNDTQTFSSPLQIGSQSWKIVAVGSTHTAGILSTGALYAWGQNGYGQLGTNDLLARNSPVQIGNSSWITVSVGEMHTIALRKDGGLFVWGDNSNGQLGNNTAATAAKSSPIQIGTSSWISISAGYGFNIAIRKDGGLFVWGDNTYGQLGNNGNTAKSSPIQLGTSSWIAIAAGIYHGMAIRKDSGLFTWGWNAYGQLGDNTSTHKSSPIQIGTSSWIVIASGYYSYSSLAIRADRILFAWGDGDKGQLMDGSIVNKSSPIQIGTSKWKYISSSLNNSYAVRIDGALFATGYNPNGEVGDGTKISRSSPVQIGLSSWNMAPTTGQYTALAIKTAP